MRVWLLVRQPGGCNTHWRKWKTYASPSAAEQAYLRTIRGRGITLRVWWGPTEEAKRMLDDPTYLPRDGTSS